MDCVGCGSAAVTERPDLTAQGYRRFRCRDCGKQFNERSDGVLNRASLPSDIIAFVVFCRLRYRLTLRDLSEILLLRGFTVSHECVRQWEAKLLPVMGEALRKRRHGTGRSSGQSWYVDETYLKVHGRWCYLYRAIDRDGNLIDTMLSATRDMRAAQRFFRSARSVAGFVPDRVTTDGHNSYPRAIRSTLGRNVRHRTSSGLTRLSGGLRNSKPGSASRARHRTIPACRRRDGRTHWNWVFQNEQVVIHVIRNSRAASVATDVLDGHRPTIWVSDLYSAQQGRADLWQVCLAHQLRDCKFTIEAGDAIFAPRMKALLLRAVVLARRRANLAESTRLYLSATA